jgi:hypothetical protein
MLQNELIKKLAEQAGLVFERDYLRYEELKFAELIISECKRAARGEIVEDFLIDEEDDPLHREYLKGNNGGVVDSIVAIQEHFFGVEQ